MTPLELSPFGDLGASQKKSSFPSWNELLETAYRRRWFMVLGMVLGCGAGVAMVMMMAPVYKAQSKVMLTAQPGGTHEGAAAAPQIQAELALLKSPPFVQSVLEHYEKEGKPAPRENLDKLDPAAIARSIEAGTIEKSNVIQLSYTDRNPEWAATFINDLLAHHVERIATLNEQLDTRSFFKRQRNLAAQRWQEARQALAAFRELHGTDLATGDTSQMRSVIANLEAQRIEAETQVLQLESKVKFLNGEIDFHSETIAAETRLPESEATTELRSRILNLQIERSELLADYTPESQRVRQIDQRIAEAERLMIRSHTEGGTISETTTEVNPAFQGLQTGIVDTQGTLIEAATRVAALDEQIGLYKGRLGDLERAAAELDRLQNELNSARMADENYRQREEEARLAEALDESRIVNLIIVEEATVPPKPESAMVPLKIATGLLLGFLIGALWAFVGDWSNPTIKSSLQARRLAGDAPILAEIPTS